MAAHWHDQTETQRRAASAARAKAPAGGARSFNSELQLKAGGRTLHTQIFRVHPLATHLHACLPNILLHLPTSASTVYVYAVPQ